MIKVNYSGLISVILLTAMGVPGAEDMAAPGGNSADQPKKIKWLQSYDKGLQAADTPKRPVLLYFEAPWCGWCRQMENIVWSQSEIIQQLEDYVCIKIDVTKNRKTAFAYGVSSLPRMVILNNYREIVGDWLGYRDAEQMSQLLLEIRNNLDKQTGFARAPIVAKDQSQVDLPLNYVLTDPNDSARVIALLGNRDVRVREKVINYLTQMKDAAIPIIREALRKNYLGTRIAAWQAVQKLQFTKLHFDPWASKQEREALIKKMENEFRKKENRKPKGGNKTPPVDT